MLRLWTAVVPARTFGAEEAREDARGPDGRFDAVQTALGRDIAFGHSARYFNSSA
jgi:hypothetical protein